MAPVIFLLALVIILGAVLILFPIFIEYLARTRKFSDSSQSLSNLDIKGEIASGYRYVCWLTGSAMIASAIVLLFRIGW
ncbi:hypothetical protein [Brunnivagina elsteri]|uniref:Uncharacterized protein n=1 Tax=Brunnivagina elsteri CCALA 953 TaxID=987040 RepID=A0A2A2TJ03_9CYAN|nr:hypothetical protein [Calothrix elsteri]PAX53984.1 hypothetical protein CK510_12895 [Calothrix elsteri CCALA 953]